MFRSANRVSRFAAVVVIALVALAAFGFAAANTVPATDAGDGSAAISGYTVSNVRYNLNATNPANLDGVQFDLAPATATSVQAKVVSASATYTACTGGPTSWTCNVGGTVLAADQLRVVAAQ